MTAIATLRATNCTRLLHIADGVVAACGTKTAYIFQYDGAVVTEASCTAPREAETFAPWLPPGAALSTTRAVYCVRKDGGYAVMVQAAEPSADAIEVVAGLTERVEELRIFFQSVLTVQSSSEVRFYHLDPSTGAATAAMGACALPAWAEGSSARVEVVSSECWRGAAERTVVVLCLSQERLFAAVVVCASSSAATVVRGTPAEGVPLPSAPATLVGWTVRWDRQEVLLLLSESATAQTKALHTFSLCTTSSSSGGRAAYPLLGSWGAADTLHTAEADMSVFTDIGSGGDGAQVWLCDTVTGPSVVLREVATAQTEAAVVALPGTKVNARLAIATAMSGVFVLVGRSLYMVKSAAAEHATSTKQAAAGQEATMSDWLAKQATPSRKVSEAKAESQPPVQAPPAVPAAKQAGAKLPLKPSHAATPVLTSSGSQIKEKLLAYVLGTAASVDCVIRDCVYVRQTIEAGGRHAFRHDILAAIAEKFGRDAEQHALATLRYATVAQSLHPYTVLALLNVRGGTPHPAAPVPGLLLALATVLAEKPTLQHGGLQRLPDFATASAAFFNLDGAENGGCPFASELARKRYTADVCGCAMAALAHGGLGATRLLFAVADRAVSVLYGGRAADTTSSPAASARATASAARREAEEEEEEHACESTIAEAVSLMRSYVEWSLTASSSIGLMTAHVGAPQTLTKEAALRDGRSHPIDTSRQVEIRPLQVTRLPKRTL